MQLDKIQQDVVDKILNKEVNSLYLTGEGGSGKSEIIKAIRDTCYERQRRVLLLAPTNEAANNIGGITLHKAFGLHLEVDEEAVKESEVHVIKIDEEKLFRNFTELNLRSNDIVIIDEISMGGKTLGKVLKLMRQFEKRNNGLSTLLLVGDPKQLPPVKDKAVDWGNRCNETVVLTKNYRTSNPVLKKEILNFRDTGDMTIVDRVPTVDNMTDLVYDDEVTYIAYKNATLADLQEQMFGETKNWVTYGTVVSVFASSTTHHVLTADKRTNELAKVPYFTTGSQLRVTSNPTQLGDHEDLFVVSIENPEHKGKTVYDDDERWAKPLVVITGDYRAYNKLLQKLYHPINVFKREMFKKYDVSEVWQVKKRWDESERKRWGKLWQEYFEIKNKPFARHKAFITAHKAQGKSLDSVVVMWDEMKNEKLRYVAISRAKENLLLVTKEG